MKRFIPVCFLAIAFVFSANASFAGDGEAIYAKYCKACHGKDPSQKSAMSKPIKGISVDKIIVAMDGKSEGLNKKYALMVKTVSKKNLSDEDKKAVAEYLQ